MPVKGVPFQREDASFPEAKERIDIDEPFASSFDDAWYLAAHPDVREAVGKRRLASGLEHYARHGKAEGRTYRLLQSPPSTPLTGLYGAFRRFWKRCAPRPPEGPAPLHNSIQALVAYSRGLTVLSTGPVDIIFVVSTICNLRCVMCPHGMRLVDRPRHMPLDLMEKSAAFVATASRMIVSGLGEPTLAPAFWWLLEKLNGRGDVFVRVNSNGHFMTPATARKILASGLSEISFSLDAASPATYARIRGGDFQKALSGIATLLNLRKTIPTNRTEILINMTLMRENLPEAAAFVTLAKGLGADGIIFSQLFEFGNRPDWRVERDAWTFTYSDQMLTTIPAEAGHHIARARTHARALAMPVQYQSNILSYVDDGVPA